MKKEDRKTLRELDKQLSKFMRSKAKDFNYKIISQIVYQKRKAFFVSSLFSIIMRDEKRYIELYNFTKPYAYDDVFWDILGMEENKKGPTSLRAIGAFTAPSIIIGTDYIEIADLLKVQEQMVMIYPILNSTFQKFLESFYAKEDFFNKKVLEEPVFSNDNKLMQVLASIRLGRYSNAIAIATRELNSNKSGGFETDGVDIYQHVINYCEKKIAIN